MTPFMEKFNLNYSLKNIPTPSRDTYTLQLIDKVEAVIKRMRWKLYWYYESDNNYKDEQNKKETYGFRSKNTPPPQLELESFENDLFNMIASIKFRNSTDDFQKKIQEDIRQINNSDKVLVFADKTTNIYKLSIDEHSKLLKNNVTKTYKKAPPKLEKSINLEAKYIASSYSIDNRAECLANTPAFITLKDHKENFQTKLPCRLINPCKSNIGAVSKSILDRINSDIRGSTNVNQWKNTNEVLNWFDSIGDKASCQFIQLDIKEFYPSISKELLTNALEFARQHTTISEKETRTILHCRKSLLFFKDEAWIKKCTDDCFDVTMGSYDGAEICELIGLLLLHNLSKIIAKKDAGLYRDDGLIVVCNMQGCTAEKLRQKIINIFKSFDLQIEIAIGLPSVDFLDVTLDLKSNSFRPYKNQMILFFM